MSVRKIRNSWWVDFRFEHLRYRIRSPENTRPGASAYEALLKQRLARGEPVIPKPAEAGVTFAVFAAEWFETYVKTNNKPSEVHHKESVLRTHILPFFGAMALASIGVATLEQYKAAKLARGLSPKTINNHLAIVGRCLSSAVEWGRIPHAPRVRHLRTPPSTPDFLSDEECEQILGDHTEPAWRAMLLLALRTGMRQGELLGLEWCDVDFDRPSIAVTRSCVRGIVTSPKSNKIRHIPMTSDLLAVFGKMRRRQGLVFDRPDGTHLSDSLANGALHRIQKRTGLRPVHWHLFRHTFASQLVRRGIPLRKVQALLGHSTITMTERYAHLAPSDLDEAIDVLEPTYRCPRVNSGHAVVSGSSEGALERVTPTV